MTKTEFKTLYLQNLKLYLPTQYKDVEIKMRVAKKGEQGLYADTETTSVRQVNNNGIKWRVAFKPTVTGCNLDQIMLNAHYRTAEVDWDYPLKRK